MDIEEFYSADERRRQSAEVELGTNWFDAKGSRYELSWVEDTGELYVMLELVPEADSWTPFGDIEVEEIPVDRVLVMVVGYIPTLEDVERILCRLARPHGQARRHLLGGRTPPVQRGPGRRSVLTRSGLTAVPLTGRSPSACSRLWSGAAWAERGVIEGWSWWSIFPPGAWLSGTARRCSGSRSRLMAARGPATGPSTRLAAALQRP